MSERSAGLVVVLLFLASASCTLDHLVGVSAGGQDADTCYVFSSGTGREETLLLSVDLSTAMHRVVARWSVSTEVGPTGAMAYDGHVFVAPAWMSGEMVWVSLDPANGHVERLAGIGSTGVLSVGLAWTGVDWVAPWSTDRGEVLARYPTLAALASGTPSLVLPTPSYPFLAVEGDRLYGASRTAAVEVRQLATGVWVERVDLRPWDLGLNGLSVVGRVVYLLSSPSGEAFATIYSVDLDTGAQLARAKVPGVWPAGLHCAESAL